jgi:hypothetical protein
MLFAPYSKSRLDRSICPWSFAQRYVKEALDKKKDLSVKKYNLLDYDKKDSINLIFGSTVHSIFELLLQREINISHHVPDIIMESEHEMYNFPIILNMVKEFKEKFKDVSDVYGLEEKLAVTYDGLPAAYDDENVFVRAKLDQIKFNKTGEKAIIIDYKTQPNIINPHETFQMPLYAWILWKNFPKVEIVETELYFARYGVFRSEIYGIDELDWIETWVKTRVDKIEKIDDFTVAKRCSFCNLCSFLAKGCPLLERETGSLPDMIINQDVANVVFEEIIGMDARLKQAKDLMKDWVENNGPVSSEDGLTLGYRPTASVEYETGIVELLGQHEFKEELLQVNKKNLEKFINKLLKKEEDPVFLKKILNLQREKKGTRFEIYKKKEVGD